MAKILLDAGADVNSKDWDGDTPLHLAAALGHYNVLELFVNHPSVQINVQVRVVIFLTVGLFSLLLWKINYLQFYLNAMSVVYMTP